MSPARLLPLAFATGLTLGACRQDDPNHCLHNGGDEFCGPGAYCTNNCGGDYQANGCLVAEQPPSADCWACMGEGSENCDGMAEDTGSETATETATDTTVSETATETTAESSTTEGPECMDSSMCGGETPLCEDGACVACGEGVMTNCASEYPDTPACDATGACVECTSEDAAACGGMTPVCEGNVCVACDEHDECPESACNMSTGACMDPARVWWVDQGAADGGDGSEAMPFNSFADALGLIGDGEEGTIYLSTINAHQEQLSIVAGKTLAIVGTTPSGFVQVAGGTAISVDGRLFASELAISGSNTGLQCGTGGEYNLADVQIRANTVRGVSTDGCVGQIRRSEIIGNMQGGIRVIDGTVSIANSMIGGDINDYPSLDILGGSVTVLYSTMIAGFGNAKALNCAGGGAGSSIRNSLIVARTDNPEIVGCEQAEITNNAMEGALAGNTSLGAMNIAWFPMAAMADFHIGMNVPAPLTTAATWQTGDPATDIDGDARPTVDGSQDYAGADIPN